MPRRSRRPFASLVLGLALLAGTAMPALAWGNGGNLGNGYGTHDWIISQALKVFGDSPPAWLDVNAALLASDDPDKVFWAANEHVFYEKGYGRGAVDRISEFYHQTLVAHQAGDDATASTTFGWMAHYVGDILQPYHTNYAAIKLDDSHLRYENLVGVLTRNPDASPEWITDDRTPKAINDVRATSIAAAAYSRKFFPELYSIFKVDETVLAPRVLEITGYLLKRASADLADMLYSIDQGVGEAAPVDSVKASVQLAVRGQEQQRRRSRSRSRESPGSRSRACASTSHSRTRPAGRGSFAATRPRAGSRPPLPPSGRARSASVGTSGSPSRPVTSSRRRRHGSRPAASWRRERPASSRRSTTRRSIRERRSASASLARDRSGRGVPNLKVSWTLTFRNGKVVKGSGYTNAQGRAAMTLPITDCDVEGPRQRRRAHPVREREPDIDLEFPHLLSRGEIRQGPVTPSLAAGFVDSRRSALYADRWTTQHAERGRNRHVQDLTLPVVRRPGRGGRRALHLALPEQPDRTSESVPGRDAQRP